MPPVKSLVFLLVGLLLNSGAPAAEPPRKLLLIAGPDSHGYGEHEYYGGCVLVAKWINAAKAGVQAEVLDGWPADPKALETAAGVAIFCDGGAASLVTRHRAELDALAKRGGGVALFHYALVVPKGADGDRLRDWIGGYYEAFWGVNPFWTAKVERLPDHPATRGVRPFTLRDEWYFHMRFRENMDGVTPLLEAVPPDEARNGPDGEYSGNAAVRAGRGQRETLAWAVQRTDGGRGFGFTGGHDQWNWAQDDFRKLVLNALVWISGAPVPDGGVTTSRPTAAELTQPIRKPRPAAMTDEAIAERLHAVAGD